MCTYCSQPIIQAADLMEKLQSLKWFLSRIQFLVPAVSFQLPLGCALISTLTSVVGSVWMLLQIRCMVLVLSGQTQVALWFQIKNLFIFQEMLGNKEIQEQALLDHLDILELWEDKDHLVKVVELVHLVSMAGLETLVPLVWMEPLAPLEFPDPPAPSSTQRAPSKTLGMAARVP